MRFALTLTVIYAASAPVVAQQPQPVAQPIPWANKFFLAGIEKNPAQAAPPVIVHDFGTVPKGTLGIHKFTITNIYDVPIQVTDVRRSCGCLEAYPPQRVLQANETAEFVVTMDTAKFNGPNAQTIYVTFGPQYVSTAVLRMQGNSRADVTISPGMVNLGTVSQGVKASKAVTIEYSGRQRDWAVTGVVTPSGPLDVAVKETGRGFVGTKYEVTVNLKPDAPAGQFADVISLKTNDPSAPVIQVNVGGLVQADLTLTPKKVEFTGMGKVKVGDTATLTVLVRGKDPFKIEPVADLGDGFAVEGLFPGAAPNQRLTVRFTPTKAGRFTKEIVLKTNLKGGATTTLLVEGEAVGP